MTKITPEHLARSAFIYVRQSTSDQVLNNHESRHRQYALVDRARALGWLYRSEVHALDGQVAELGSARRRQAVRVMIAEELHVALGGEHAEPFADGVLAAEPALVLEPVRELRAGVYAAFGGLVVEQLEDDVVLAPALGIEPLAVLPADQPLAATVDLDPLAVDLVDDLWLDRGAVPELEEQLALGPVLVRPAHQDAAGVEAAQAAGAGERLEGILGQQLLGDLPGDGRGSPRRRGSRSRGGPRRAPATNSAARGARKTARGRATHRVAT